MNKFFEQSYLVTPSISNAEQHLPLSLLVSQIIELATDHANHLGIGFLSMQGKEMGWVLSRLSVEMEKWPATGDTYTITTWVEGWNRHYSERCFVVKDAAGMVLGYLRTVWMIIELDTHKSLGTAGLELPQECIGGIDCPIVRQQRHKPFVPEYEAEYVFKYTDLDYYRHVNTIRHIALIQNQVPLEVYDTNHLYRFEIAFMHEAKYGEKAVIKRIRERMENPLFMDGKVLSSAESFSFEMLIEEQPVLRARMFFTPDK